jgi:anti-sigma factor RsiW
MNCQAFEPLIALYIEGDLPGQDTPRVEAHLAACAGCREFLEDLQASQAAVKELVAERVDGALLAAVRAGVLQKIDNRRRVLWPWVAAAATALALLALFRTPSPPVAHDARPVTIATAPKASGLTAPVISVRRPGRRPGPRIRAAKGHAPPLVVKMLTNDPDIVIIWLVDQTGD